MERGWVQTRGCRKLRQRISLCGSADVRHGGRELEPGIQRRILLHPSAACTPPSSSHASLCLSPCPLVDSVSPSLSLNLMCPTLSHFSKILTHLSVSIFTFGRLDHHLSFFSLLPLSPSFPPFLLVPLLELHVLLA